MVVVVVLLLLLLLLLLAVFHRPKVSGHFVRVCAIG